MVKETYELPVLSQKDVRQDNDEDTVNGVSTDNETKLQEETWQDMNTVDSEMDSSDDEGVDNTEYREYYLKCGGVVARCRREIYNSYLKRRKIFKIIFGLCLLGAYFVYFGFCMHHSFGDEGSLRLLFGTIFVMLVLVWINFGNLLKQCFFNHVNCQTLAVEKFRRGVRWSLYLSTAIFTLVYLSVVVLVPAPDNAKSLAGIVFFIIVGFLFSKHPDLVNWHAVYWGLMTQFFFALFILRTHIGHDIFHWLGERVGEFMSHVHDASVFVFGKTYTDHNFTFGVMPQVILMSSTITVFYHFGIIQAFVAKFGWFLCFCLGTSPIESVNAAVNLFLGPAESPMTIKPFLPHLTSSEMHAIMAAGFASIAGSVFGIITSLGASPDHLLAASVMSAPAALAMSKLLLPETRRTKIKPNDAYTIPMAVHRNFFEAISTGAVESIKLIGTILVNQIIFIAAVDVVDGALLWFGDRVGFQGLTFALICSYVFYPLAFLMGFPAEDSFKIGELLGIKIFANSFVGFAEYGKVVRNRYALEAYSATYNGSWYYKNRDIYLEQTNTTLVGGMLSKRSEVMGVYAFCGLNHLGAVGVTMGVLTALAPQRKTTISKHVIRANITGHIACFMTACIAGLLFNVSDVTT